MWITMYIVTQTASVTSRTRLRSGSSLRYEQPRTWLKFGQRAFPYAAPAAWDSLPPSLQELFDTASFKRNLKTLLFQRAFYLWVFFTFCTLSLGFILVFMCVVHHWSLCKWLFFDWLIGIAKLFMHRDDGLLRGVNIYDLNNFEPPK